MILHIYLNENRLKDLASQIKLNDNPNESKSTEKEIKISAEISGGIPKFLEYLGFAGEAKLGTEGSYKINKDITPFSVEYNLLKIFNSSISKNEFNYVNILSKAKDYKTKYDLIRINLPFSMKISGTNGFERVDEFTKGEYFEWEANANDITLKMGTSKESYTGRTPIFKMLNNGKKKLDLEVFGVVMDKEQIQNKLVLSIIPIYFGVDID